MKKTKKAMQFLAIFSVVAMICAYSALAGPDMESYGDVSYVPQGHIKIDAVKDEAAWENALVIPVDRQYPSTPNTKTSGTAWLLWTETGIYAFVEVSDPTPIRFSPEAIAEADNKYWTTDNFEAFVDFYNSGDVDTVMNYMVTNYGDYVHVNKEDAQEWIEYAVRLDGDKYYVECFWYAPYGDLQANAEIGLLLVISDRTNEDIHDDGDRGILVSPGSDQYAGGWDVAYHDYVVLSADTAILSEITATEAIDDVLLVDVPPETPTTPSSTGDSGAVRTGDPMMVLFVFLAASILALIGIAYKKVHKFWQ